jgi:mRNA interferase RelE/StbE
LAKSAEADLAKLDGKVVKRVFGKIEALSVDPRPPGCRKIQGAADLWRIRVGDYRVIYQVLDDLRTIDIITIRHWRDAYRFD